MHSEPWKECLVKAICSHTKNPSEDKEVDCTGWWRCIVQLRATSRSKEQQLQCTWKKHGESLPTLGIQDKIRHHWIRNLNYSIGKKKKKSVLNKYPSYESLPANFSPCKKTLSRTETSQKSCDSLCRMGIKYGNGSRVISQGSSLCAVVVKLKSPARSHACRKNTQNGHCLAG